MAKEAPLSVRLGPERKARLANLAQVQETSVHALVVAAVDAFLDAKPDGAPKAKAPKVSTVEDVL